VQLYRYFVSQSGEFATITLCVASQQVVVVVVVAAAAISLSTQSGNFWIHFYITVFTAQLMNLLVYVLLLGFQPPW
jgi:hypothetical protein